MILTRKQTQAIDFLEDPITTELYFGGAAGGGKSLFGCYWQLKRRHKYPGTRGLIGRAELKNLKKTTLNSFFECCQMQGLRAGTHYRYNQQESIIHFPNESQIILADLYAYPSDPEFDSLGSLEITDAFVDESPQITAKAKNILKSRIRFKLDDNGLIPKMLMTGNPSRNWAYYDFYMPARQKKLRQDRQFIQSLVTDNPHISPHYIESLKGLDKISRARLLDGDWEYDDDPAALIRYERILDCFTNDFPALGGDRFITVDVARLGSDKIVIGLWNGWRVKFWVYEKKRITESYEHVKRIKNEHNVPTSNIIVDEDGVGGGLVDMLGCPGFVNNSHPLPSPEDPQRDENGKILNENYNHLKSQCSFRMAVRIDNGGIFIECDDPEYKGQIIQEMEQVKQHNMDKDGKKQILPKDIVKGIIGRSPDFWDAIMMREWFELKKKFTWVGF